MNKACVRDLSSIFYTSSISSSLLLRVTIEGTNPSFGKNIFNKLLSKKMYTRAMFARRVATSTASSAHKSTNKRAQSSFFKVWAAEKAAYPIIGITLLAATMATYKVFHAAMNPDYHFNRHERRTLDFLENERDTEKIKNWSENTIHKPPAIVKSLGRAKGYIGEDA